MKTAKKDKIIKKSTKIKIDPKFIGNPKNTRNLGMRSKGKPSVSLLSDSPSKDVTTGTKTDIPKASANPDNKIKNRTNLRRGSLFTILRASKIGFISQHFILV